MKRDLTVSAARTLGMLSIVLCHLFGYSDVPSLHFLSEIFNVGTPLFLFISGFLYGEKAVDAYPKWFYRRFRRICIPMYLYMTIVFVYRFFFVTHAAEGLKYLLYALNLQGVCFVCFRLDYALFSVAETDQLWFLTVIMLCYLLVPPLSRLRPRVGRLRPAAAAAALVFTLAAQTALLYAGINISYFVLFSVGYLLTCFWDRLMPARRYAVLTALTAAALLFRFACNCFDAGSWYENAVVPLTHGLFALWIYFTVFLISLKAPKAFEKTVGGRFFSLLDDYSFYIYMTHFMFVSGSLATLGLTPSFPLNALITLALSVAAAAVLRLLSSLALNGLKRRGRFS